MRQIAYALLLAALATSANAAFLNESSDNPFATGTQIKVFGTTNAKSFEVIRGMGREQPLSEAVTQIVPRGYAIKVVGVERWIGTPVTWKGGKEWPEVLKDVLANTPEIIAEIEVDSKSVMLRNRADAKAAPTATVASASTWDVRTEDKTVKAMLTRWAAQAGWQMVWESAVDYPILAGAAINGCFEEAVEAIVRSMQGAEVPPKAVFYENRVLRITSKGVE